MCLRKLKLGIFLKFQIPNVFSVLIAEFKKMLSLSFNFFCIHSWFSYFVLASIN